MKNFEKFLGLISFILLVWILISFIDVNMHNDIMSSNYGHFARWNLFEIIFKYIKG